MVALHRALPFWNSLSELQQAKLLDYTVIRHYEAGEYLERRPGLYIVGDGAVYACTAHESGRRRTAFAAHWMDALLLTPQFLASGSAFSFELYVREDSEIWFIPYGEWRSVEEWSRETREYATTLLSAQMSRLLFGLYTQMEKNIARRLAMFLLYIYDSKKGDDGSVIRISHEELAEQIGKTREAVTRNLNSLKEAGFIQTGRSKIKILNPEALRGYADLQPGYDWEEEDEKICKLSVGNLPGARDSFWRRG